MALDGSAVTFYIAVVGRRHVHHEEKNSASQPVNASIQFAASRAHQTAAPHTHTAMKLSSALALIATIALGVAHAEEGKVGVPESYTAPKTALGHPIHFTALGSRGHHNEGAVGVPVSLGHPRHHHHNKFAGSSSSSSSSSSDDDDVAQLNPHQEAIAKLLALYGKHGNHGKGSNSIYDLPTPAPTTYVTPAPTVPNHSATPSPTTPTFAVTPSPTVPTPAPTSTSDASVVDTAQPDASNPYIKQVELPTETPAATLTVESPTPVTELLRDSDAVATALSANVASGESSDPSESSVALPVVVLGCVAAALAVAVAVFVQKKRAQTSDDKTASPSASTEVDYKNEMVTPV